jgi:hypothetical protein
MMKNVMSGSKDQFYNTQSLRHQEFDVESRARWGRNAHNMMVDRAFGESSNTV